MALICFNRSLSRGCIREKARRVVPTCNDCGRCFTANVSRYTSLRAFSKALLWLALLSFFPYFFSAFFPTSRAAEWPTVTRANSCTESLSSIILLLEMQQRIKALSLSLSLSLSFFLLFYAMILSSAKFTTVGKN